MNTGNSYTDMYWIYFTPGISLNPKKEIIWLKLEFLHTLNWKKFSICYLNIVVG